MSQVKPGNEEMLNLARYSFQHWTTYQTYAALGQLTAASLWLGLPLAILAWTNLPWIAGLWGFATAIGVIVVANRSVHLPTPNGFT
ncbi:MAG TPA: hypothetical protein PKA27_06725 [Fimbriimonadaceae bacterium]|nr:hypothetical protein [Fimbriimonadaceae bacterium]